MLGFPLLYFKGMRLMMFQLSSFYCTSRVKSPLSIWVISIVTPLITLLITTHEPPSRDPASGASSHQLYMFMPCGLPPGL